MELAQRSVGPGAALITSTKNSPVAFPCQPRPDGSKSHQGTSAESPEALCYGPAPGYLGRQLVEHPELISPNIA